MISEKIAERLADVLTDRIEELNVVILEEIGKSIAKVKTLSTAEAYELVQLLKYGDSYQKIKRKLAEVTNLNEKQIGEIFEEVAKRNQSFAKQFYDYRGIDFIPYEENFQLQQYVRAFTTTTQNTFKNLMRTSAFMTYENGVKTFTPLADIYQKTLDKAIISSSLNGEGFDVTMRKVMRELAKSGIRTVSYPSGYSRRLDSSVRMNLLDGIRTMSNEMQKQFGEEFGADGIEISVHEYPAEDHEDIQGLQMSRESFEILNSNLERPIGTLNCYHYIFSIVLGVSRPEYTEAELENLKNKNHIGFEFEGTHYTMYEGTQLQRKIETKVRELKDRQIGARAMGDMEEVGLCQEKILQLNRKYKQLSEISGLKTKRQRMAVSGYKRVKVDKKQ